MYSAFLPCATIILLMALHYFRDKHTTTQIYSMDSKTVKTLNNYRLSYKHFLTFFSWLFNDAVSILVLLG
jgi:hypothetical protein